MNDRARGVAAAQTIAALVRPEILAQKAYVVAPAAGMVKLDANESPHGLPAAAALRLAAALAGVELNRYPQGAADEVRAVLRSVLAIPPSLGLILGNGSDELISLIISLLARPHAVIMAPEPTFVMYRVSTVNAGARFVGVPLRPDFTLDGEAMRSAIARERPAAIFLASPNNPTGVQYSTVEVEAILRVAPGLVVLDEAYAGFAETSFRSRVAEFPNLLLMATLSKVGMAGLRLGYAIAAPEWIAELDKLRPPYNVNSLTQAAVCALLPDSAWIGEQATAIGTERRHLAAALAQIRGVEVFPSQANFLLVRVGDANRLFDGLKARRILVKQVAGGHALLANCLRITVGTPDENALLLSAMTELTQ